MKAWLVGVLEANPLDKQFATALDREHNLDSSKHKIRCVSPESKGFWGHRTCG